jgi:hypothetical protein
MGTGHAGAGLFTVVFWIRAAIASGYAGLPVLLAGISVWWATHRARLDVPAGPVRRARAGRLSGMGVGAIAGVGAIWCGQGLLAPTAVTAGYLFGMLTGEILRAPRPSGPLRVASLATRSAGRYVPRWTAPVALTAGVLTIVAPAALAGLPRVRYGPWSPDGHNTQFTLPGATLSWPSAAASVPLAVVAALALVAGAILMRRVALLPPVAVDQPGVDERGRRNSARAVAGAVVGIELLALAALAILTSDGLAVPAPVGGDAYLGSRILVWSGLSLATAAVMVLCAMGWWRRGPVEPSPAASPHPAAA